MKKIKIMSYNLGWLQGDGSEGVNYKKKSKEHFGRSISVISKMIKDNDIDIACFQEIDFDSKKSHFINQFDTILNNTKYYGAKIISWDIPYLPFPYFNHWGKVISGGAIVSKKKAEPIAHYFFDAPTDMFFLKRLFYLKRYIQIIQVKFKDKNEYIFNLHLEAFDFKAKTEQLNKLKLLIEEFNPIAVCGDFNTIPKDHNPKVDIDYSLDPGIDLLPKIMTNYHDIFGQELTFPTGNENCRLDYIWVRNGIEAKTIQLKYDNNPSDHKPISLELF